MLFSFLLDFSVYFILEAIIDENSFFWVERNDLLDFALGEFELGLALGFEKLDCLLVELGELDSVFEDSFVFKLFNVFRQLLSCLEIEVDEDLSILNLFHSSEELLIFFFVEIEASDNRNIRYVACKRREHFSPPI